MNPSAIVAAFQSTITNISYKYKRVVHRSAIDRVGKVLQSSVRHTVKVAMHSSHNGQPKWNSEVLNPIIADFHFDEDLGVSKKDFEYIVLLTTVVLLGYEILLQRWENLSEIDQGFITKAFFRYLNEPGVCDKVTRAIEAEGVRLKEANAEINTLSSVWILGDLLKSTSEAIKLQKGGTHKSVLVNRTEVTNETKRTESPNQSQGLDAHITEVTPMIVVDSPSTPSTYSSEEGTRIDTIQLSSTSTVYQRHVEAQIFLKPGRSHDFAFVNSVRLRDNTTTIETCVGLKMKVEKGATMSEIWGDLDTVTIKMPKGNGYTLSATIVIPCGFSYPFSDVLALDIEKQEKGLTEVETTNATIWICNGSYTVHQSSDRKHVTVKCVYG